MSIPLSLMFTAPQRTSVRAVAAAWKSRDTLNHFSATILFSKSP